VKHSRVARSALHVLSTLGVAEIRVVAPRGLMPDAGEFMGCERFTSLDGGIAGVDVVMMLRIQKERMAGATMGSDRDYAKGWGLTKDRFAKLKSDALVMHPGPINRGVEIDSDVADDARSVILEQAENGVAVRMAVLYLLALGHAKVTPVSAGGTGAE
jgi:aspartate carbamoyltransferase catalytic subunit